jgi:hypothetical protein
MAHKSTSKDSSANLGSGPAPAGFVQSEKFVESHGGQLGDISTQANQLAA